MSQEWSAKLAPPPRDIQPLLSAQMLLAGAASQIGWLFFGFGSIFFWLFGAHADLSGWRFQPGKFDLITGQSMGCKETGYSEGGRGHSIPVYRNLYYYSVDGRAFKGSSFATGKCAGGGAVTVEYLSAHPEISRIAGMRRSLLSAGALLVVLFPGAGLVVIIFGLRNGCRNIRLLRDGRPTTGRLIDKAATGTRVNNRVVYRMTFEYATLGGRTCRTSTRTNQPERLEDESVEWLLYDPWEPSRAVMIDSLPGTVTVNPSGQPAPSGSRAFLFLPVVALLLNGWFLYRQVILAF